MASLRRLLIGKPISTEHAEHARLPKVTALAVFASDALSSTAYATQEIMLALTVTIAFSSRGADLSNLSSLLPIGIGIGILLAIVATSYRQTVYAYPQGGGAYLVAKENFGVKTGLVAAAALLIDYILTVAVSIAAGVAAITSALQSSSTLQGLLPSSGVTPTFTIGLCLFFIWLITILNLRGVKESGTLFAVPTYLFVLSMLVLLGTGFYKHFLAGGLPPYAPLTAQLDGTALNDHPGLATIPLFLLLRAFASGCTALTGVEAISDGVPAFRAPESRNAAITLVWMAIILVTLFLGITALTYFSGSLPIFRTEGGRLVEDHGHIADPRETLISVLAHRTFDNGAFAWFYYVIQAGTAMILVLAANTAYADFPRLSSILARDRFMPRQLANIGDRLAFNNGIVALAVCSSILIIGFKGSVTALISLYAVGVFLSFTLSQAGMVLHWKKKRTPNWQLTAAVNATGAVATFIVMCIIAATKFLNGAWMVIAAIPVIVLILSTINRHYKSVAKQLSLENYRPAQGVRNQVFVLVPDIHRGVIPALQYARSISPDAKALHVSIDPSREARLRERWTLYSRGVPLTILPSPYRSLVDPIVAFVDKLKAQEPNTIVTLVVPEFLPTGLLAKLLHGQAALLLNVRLHQIRGVVVITVPYHIESFVELEHSYDPNAFHAEETARRNGTGTLNDANGSNGHANGSNGLGARDIAAGNERNATH